MLSIGLVTSMRGRSYSAPRTSGHPHNASTTLLLYIWLAQGAAITRPASQVARRRRLRGAAIAHTAAQLTALFGTPAVVAPARPSLS